MKRFSITPRQLTILFSLVILALLLVGFSPPRQATTRTTTSNDTPAICYVIFLPLWLLSMWYWYRHYKIRGKNTILPIIIVIVFSGLAVAAMVIDAIWRAVGSQVEIGPCPNCGKDKIIREGSYQYPHITQPYCPHCKMYVGAPMQSQTQSATPSVTLQLDELQRLLTNGVITQEEFDSKKTELLSRI